MTTEFTEIIETCLEHCTPVRLNSPWNFVPPSDETMTLECTNEELAAALIERHDVDQLVSSGIMSRTDEGELALNQCLLTEDRNLVVLRDDANSPIDILTSAGTCTGVVPLFSLLEDASTRRFVEETESTLFVVSCFEDLILLRSLEIGVAPLTGLDRLDEVLYGQLAMLTGATCTRRGHNLQQCECLAPPCNTELVGTARQQSHHPDPLQLTFITGSLSAFGSELAPRFGTVAHELPRAERFLGLTFDQTRVWWLSSENVAALRFYCELHSCQLVREFILEDRELFELRSFRNPRQLPRRKTPPPTLADVTANLVELLSDPSKRTGKSRELANLRKTYRDRVDTNLFRPMIKAALEADDAAKANLKVVLADLFRILHHSMPGIMAEVVNGIDDQRAGSERELLGTAHIERMRDLTDTALKVYRQLFGKERPGWGS